MKITFYNDFNRNEDGTADWTISLLPSLIIMHDGNKTALNISFLMFEAVILF